jgi:NitT/TauT family transport system ATP-binding protein
MPNRPDDIVVSDVGIAYRSSDRDVIALRDVSMTVKRGQMCCVVGPSGCGKSTLLKAMLGLVNPDEGTITIDDERRREGVAYVQQDSPLLPWRTVLQNACLGAEVRGQVTEVVRKRVRRTLSELGLSDFDNNMTTELSGGMRQRVALARALESKPALLFCDEPFSAIDFVGRLALSAKFKFMCRVEGITTVFVTHNIEEAIFLGDTIVVLTGRPGRVKNVYNPQLSVGAEDAVKCREAPEFAILFKDIWRDLEDNHE